MSKHFSIYATESQFIADATNLDYPHVSLIDTTGELKYATYTGKDVADAPFGSILMAEVATNKLFYIESAEYNLTDYPIADYKPIAVCIYDKASNANNEAVFMSVQWMDYTALGQGKPSDKNMSWGFSNVNLSQEVSGIRDTGANHISSKVINEAMKELVTKDYSGTSITDNGEYTAFCCCWRFSTPGTSEGDWYLPSYYDMMKYQQNYAAINNVLTAIKNVTGTSYLDKINMHQWVAGEAGHSYSHALGASGSFYTNNKTSASSVSVRAVFITGLSSN